MTFWSTLVTVAVGAFLGSGAAFASNLLAGRISERRAQVNALSELVHEIHFRRALRRQEPVRSPRADVLDPDYDAARHSIATLRGDIRRARRATLLHSPARPVLDTMTLACNTYLDEAESAPDGYRLALMQLQHRLGAAVRALSVGVRGVDDLEPGDASLAASDPSRPFPTSLVEPPLPL